MILGTTRELVVQEMGKAGATYRKDLAGFLEGRGLALGPSVRLSSRLPATDSQAILKQHFVRRGPGGDHRWTHWAVFCQGWVFCPDYGIYTPNWATRDTWFGSSWFSSFCEVTRA